MVLFLFIFLILFFLFLIPPHVSCFWLILEQDEGWMAIFFCFLFSILNPEATNKNQNHFIYFWWWRWERNFLRWQTSFLIFVVVCHLLQSSLSFGAGRRLLGKMAQKSFFSFYIIRFPCDFSCIYFYCAEKEANLIFNRRWKYSCNIRYYVCHPTIFFFKGKSNHCERERDSFFVWYDYVTDVRWWC